jgi:hypothetical protein
MEEGKFFDIITLNIRIKINFILIAICIPLEIA